MRVSLGGGIAGIHTEEETMEIRKAELLLIRAGFVLFTLALLTGLAVPAFLNQKMAVAAHLTGVVNALLLILSVSRGAS